MYVLTVFKLYLSDTCVKWLKNTNTRITTYVLCNTCISNTKQHLHSYGQD